MIRLCELGAIISVCEDAGVHIAKSMRERIAMLDEIQREDVTAGNTPRHTWETYVAKLGESAALHTIASLINECAWDGRISQRNANWAADFVAAFDEECMRKMSAFTKMHMAHLDQIADEARKASQSK